MAAHNINPDPNGEGNRGGGVGYLYSDEIAFSVMMDNLESVQQSLRQDLKKGREGRGGKRGGGGV